MSGIIVSGQGRAHGGQHAAHRPLGQVQLMAEPLDTVGEELGRDKDDNQPDRELDELESVQALCAQVLGRVGQQRDVAGALEGNGQGTLMFGARAGLAARLDLGPLER
jgi:hypothetical protein